MSYSHPPPCATAPVTSLPGQYSLKIVYNVDMVKSKSKKPPKKKAKKKAKKKKLWERQEWDTGASFKAFHNYYLPQFPPRSLVKAYKIYRESKGADKGKIKQASGTWRKWAVGRNSADKKIRGSIAWKKRAAALDDYFAAQDIDKWEERRDQVRQDDWEMGAQLRELVKEILDTAPEYVIEKTKIIKGAKGKPDQIVITRSIDVHAAIRAADSASKLQRLASGLETDRIVDDSEKSFHVTIAKTNE